MFVQGLIWGQDTHQGHSYLSCQSNASSLHFPEPYITSTTGIPRGGAACGGVVFCSLNPAWDSLGEGTIPAPLPTPRMEFPPPGWQARSSAWQVAQKTLRAESIMMN